MEAEGTTASCFDETVHEHFANRPTSENYATCAAPDSPRSLRAASFDCSICLDFAADPVVTLCGHLYCWPCIYKWLRAGPSSPGHCPVCKAPVSDTALVPLYGRRGGNVSPQKRLDIPNRPNVVRDAIASIVEEPHPSRTPMRARYGPEWGASVFGSTAGCVLGGLGVALIRPYQLETDGSRRERRVEESLHQIWIFLCCAAVLCLLFF